MKIFGVGTDIVKANRLKKIVNDKKNLSKLFGEDELFKCSKTKNTLNCFAKRFAAKEAFSKALGTGIANGISFNEIIILNNKNGKPFIKLINKTKKLLKKN